MTHEEATLQTKTAFAASLKKFMHKKELKKITVTEIIKDCNVNRKTFYYHFSDIYDLLKWMLEQEAIEVVKNFDFLIDYEDAIHFVMEYIEENAYILNCAYDSMGRDELKRFFYNDFISIACKIIDDTEEQCGLAVTNEFKALLCDFITEVIAGMLVTGFKNKEKLQQGSAISNIKVILSSLSDILRRAPQKEI